MIFRGKREEKKRKKNIKISTALILTRLAWRRQQNGAGLCWFSWQKSPLRCIYRFIDLFVLFEAVEWEMFTWFKLEMEPSISVGGFVRLGLLVGMSWWWLAYWGLAVSSGLASSRWNSKVWIGRFRFDSPLDWKRAWNYSFRVTIRSTKWIMFHLSRNCGRFDDLMTCNAADCGTHFQLRVLMAVSVWSIGAMIKTVVGLIRSAITSLWVDGFNLKSVLRRCRR